MSMFNRPPNKFFVGPPGQLRGGPPAGVRWLPPRPSWMPPFGPVGMGPAPKGGRPFGQPRQPIVFPLTASQNRQKQQANGKSLAAAQKKKQPPVPSFDALARKQQPVAKTANSQHETPTDAGNNSVTGAEPSGDAAVAIAGGDEEDTDDVVSLFGGSDLGDPENNNSKDPAATTVAKQPVEAPSSDNTDSVPATEPSAAGPAVGRAASSAKGQLSLPATPVSNVKQTDLRNQLSQPRRGGGLLARPPAFGAPPVQSPYQLLHPPPSQQHQSPSQQQHQPPQKRARTLIESGPPTALAPSGSFRGSRGGGVRGRGTGRGGGIGLGINGPRFLLPTPLSHESEAGDGYEMDRGLQLFPHVPPIGLLQTPMAGPLIRDPIPANPDTKPSPASLSESASSTRRGLLAAPPGGVAAAAAPVVGILPTPKPAGVGAETSLGQPRAPLLSAPPQPAAGTRPGVLPVPRQMEAQAVQEPALLAAAPNTGVAHAAWPKSVTAAYGGGVSSTAIAAYPTESAAVSITGATSAGSAPSAAPAGSALIVGRPLQREPAVKTEVQLRTEITEAFKGLQFDRGYELLKEARAMYPHEFTDLVVYEVVEYCANKEAFDVCVLTARLIGEPNVKLLELLADLAEKSPGQLRHLTDELWLVFNQVLTLQPDATAMMAFIRCFSSLKSWTKVWGAVDRFAPMQIIPIEGFIFCIEALVNGSASEFVNLGISLLSNMDLQNLQQVGLELIERLWLRCALDGSAENVARIEQIRALFRVAPAQQNNFLNRIRVKITELVMSNEFDSLCRFFSSVTNLDVLSEFVIDAFHVAEDQQAKFELLSKAIAEKFRTRNPAMDVFISQTAVRLLKKSVERGQWADSLRLLRSVQGQSVSLAKAVNLTQPDMSEAFIANLAFQIYMRNNCHSIAASMLSASTSPIGIALPVAGEHSGSRFQLLQELCSACIGEKALADAAAALNAMMRHPAPRVNDLNKIYNEFLTACCEATSEELKLGVDIIPLAHQCSLVISATVLRMLLCSSFKHGLKAYAKEYLELGTRVGIYPVVSVSCPGPKTVQLQSDLTKDEIQVVLTNLFVKLKKYLMDSLQTRELDVIQECTIKLTALNVGNRDAKFIEMNKIQSSEQAVLQRASEILQTPNQFQSVVSTRLLSENGVNVLKLDGTMVYQCVYYVDEDL